MAKIYKTRKAAEKKAKKLKRDKPLSGAWGVVRAPGKKGWLVGTRSAFQSGWRLLGGGWLQEKGFR